MDTNRIVAYLGSDGVLTDWHGNKVGRYRITSQWKTPRSFLSSSMCQVVAYVNGVWYTGRSDGEGLAYVGKRKARQEWGN